MTPALNLQTLAYGNSQNNGKSYGAALTNGKCNDVPVPNGSSKVNAVPTIKDPTLFALKLSEAEDKNRIGVAVGEDGATLSVKFRGTAQVYNPTYLLVEGLYLHAKINPDGLCLRLPKLEDHSCLIDVSYRQAASILERLTGVIKKQLESAGVEIVPGTVVALLALPYVHSFFHSFALWQLGCTVQYFNHELGRSAVDFLLGGSAALLYAGLTVDEMAGLGIKDMAHRIGTKPIEIAAEDYSINAALKTDWHPARDPKDLDTFNSQFNDMQVMFIIHTSGSTGIPKLVKWDFFVMARCLKLPPHVQLDEANYVRPLMMVSRGYWGTSSVLGLSAMATGCSLAYCYPEDRLYATTKLAMDSCASCNAGSMLLYPAQATELYNLVHKSKYYADILDSIASIQWCGSGMDNRVAEQLAQLTGPTKYMNLHGMSELGFSGMTTSIHPMNGLRDTAGFALWEPMEEGLQSDANTRLVKLWIALDKHTNAWHFISRNLTPIHAQRFPGPGPKKDRPAVDTGDIFEERMTKSGPLYFHHSRDDDFIRLSNLYRPDVGELESRFTESLDYAASLPDHSLDAVQILGDKKSQMAMIVQFNNFNLQDTSFNVVEKAVSEAICDLNETLPLKVQFHGLNRVKIVIINGQGSKLGSTFSLLKTHKNSLRRRVNVISFGPWLDSLDE